MIKMDVNHWPLVSVVVHNFKGTSKLRCCLSSLLKSDYPNFEIIVVDGLTDGIDDWIQKNFPHVKLIHFNYDEGIPARLNTAFASISPNSKYVALLAEDMDVDKRWLRPLVMAMEHDPRIGIAHPLLMKMHRRNEVDCLGGFLDRIGYSSLYPLGKEVNEHDILEISYAGVGLMCRKALEELSDSQEPFDSDYFIHWFDIDLSWRIQLAGYKIVHVPNSIVYHERRLTSGRSKLPYRNIFLNSRNRMMTLIKNYSFWSLVRYIPLLIAFIAVEVIALLRKRPGHASATVRGIIWVLRNFKGVWKKHVIIQKFIRKVPDSHILKSFVRVNPFQLSREFQRHYSETG